MNNEFKTTFIPKKKLSSVRDEKNVRVTKKNSFMALIAGLLFVTALVSIVGVYLYKLNISSSLKNKIESINRTEKAFEPAVILKLKKLDIRLRAATDLLDNHVALSDFFDSFGESTLPSVSFSNFSFAFNEEASEVSMVGEAKSYLAIAQQSDLFEKNQYIQNHIFSDFQLTETGRVSFNLSFTLNPDLIKYGRKIQNTQVDSKVDESMIIENQDTTLPAGENVDFSSTLSN
jgi:hypothetical protein